MEQTSLEAKGREGDALGSRGCENSSIFQGIYKTTHMPNTRRMPKKIWEGPKFSPLAELHAPHKQEVKAKAEL